MISFTLFNTLFNNVTVYNKRSCSQSASFSIFIKCDQVFVPKNKKSQFSDYFQSFNTNIDIQCSKARTDNPLNCAQFKCDNDRTHLLLFFNKRSTILYNS